MKHVTRIFSLSFLLCILLNPILSYSQVYINEFLASNTGTTIDPDFQESADWIELYNAGNSAVNLGGYYLSDNFNDHIKWAIPAGTQIPAKGFLVIWADGYDTGLHTNFKISASGEELVLYKPGDILADSVSFGLQEPNISMGRKTDGSAEWSFFTETTPGAANSAENFTGVVQNVPSFSVLGGIFSSQVSVEIKNTFGGEIRYTTDGSEPTKNSTLVTGPIVVNTTKIIRARIYQTGKVPGRIITQSYFIDSNHEIGSLPVVSLATNPANFWDAEKGIYVQNFKPEWEVPVNIELFENDGSDRAAFNEAAGVKVNGLYSWKLPQKMLGVYFRKEYGAGKLDYPLLFDHNRKTFDSFALRASGSDWAYTLFRDGMTQSLTAENMKIDFQGYRAAVLFVNGEYMGINNLRDKVDEDFIVQNNNLAGQKIDMIENENYVETGSLDQYAAFEALYHNDLTVQANYDAVAAQMDIENFTDFVITEIYSQNTSVDHNIMAWKPQTGGKWKWILNDFDRGFFNPGSNMISFYANRDVIPLSNLLTNTGYRKYFGKRLADHLFTTFDPERVKSIIRIISSNIESEIPKHIKRWEGTSSSYGDPIPSVEYWNNEVAKMNTFADGRPTALLNDLVNYGFEKSAPLSIAVFPENAGMVTFNGIEIKQAFSQGGYPLNEEIMLTANSKGGYVFKGWLRSQATPIIAKEEIWKFNDTGTDLGTAWILPGYNDSQWKQGKAELGYGDGDENTVTSYGGDSGNKYITTYFRKNFTVDNGAGMSNLKIALKCDDGAIVYVNGIEIARQNMPSGNITSLSTALNAVSGTDESDFTIYAVQNGAIKSGTNTVAVEIHQVNHTSSDISFDLELSAFTPNTTQFTATNPGMKYTHTGDVNWTAVFESDGSCTVPEEISAEIILDKSCSPYRVPNNVTITPSGKLIINPGVELWFSDDVSVKINGSLQANGTKTEPVIFKSNPDAKNQKWGILNFVNAAEPSFLNHILIENASKGIHPQREIAAISVFHSVVHIDGAAIENVYENPIVARYSEVSLKNSKLHSEITGDLINVKYGKGMIDSCTFVGNEMPDTDAIDFDDVENGVIQNSMIRDMHGSNSDAIDIGERAKNISIKNMLVYNITDKGVSVGQQSLVNISNSIFVNCNLGAGLKDSSNVTIDHCTYYGNGISVSCFEKNVGDAGGNVTITNSILSNAYDASFASDAMSTQKILYSLTDNDSPPAENQNLFANPGFINPNLFDFRLSASSPCISAASSGNMGANLAPPQNTSQLYLSGIAYKTDLNADLVEFIVLSNSGNSAIDISGYEFTKGITFTFPENSVIQANQDIYIANNANHSFWAKKGQTVYQWESGKLADEGEAVRLLTNSGIVVDRIRYNSDATWPTIINGEAISLKSENLDNHFGSNWKATPLDVLVGAKNEISDYQNLKFYPNPTTGIVNISGLENKEAVVSVYNLSGILVNSQQINSSLAKIDLSNLEQGVYILRCADQSQRVILMK